VVGQAIIAQKRDGMGVGGGRVAANTIPEREEWSGFGPSAELGQTRRVLVAKRPRVLESAGAPARPIARFDLSPSESIVLCRVAL
jgi:hypothetical protein